MPKQKQIHSNKNNRTLFKEIKQMTISNSQMKALIDVYNMIQTSKTTRTPLSDISYDKTIKRYNKVLNDLLKGKIQENNDCITQYTNIQKEIENHG